MTVEMEPLEFFWTMVVLSGVVLHFLLSRGTR